MLSWLFSGDGTQCCDIAKIPPQELTLSSTCQCLICPKRLFRNVLNMLGTEVLNLVTKYMLLKHLLCEFRDASGFEAGRDY